MPQSHVTNKGLDPKIKTMAEMEMKMMVIKLVRTHRPNLQLETYLHKLRWVLSSLLYEGTIIMRTFVLHLQNTYKAATNLLITDHSLDQNKYIFEEIRKPEDPEKNPWSKVENWQKNLVSYMLFLASGITGNHRAEDHRRDRPTLSPTVIIVMMMTNKFCITKEKCFINHFKTMTGGCPVCCPYRTVMSRSLHSSKPYNNIRIHAILLKYLTVHLTLSSVDPLPYSLSSISFNSKGSVSQPSSWKT